ncbi:MAG: NUDIX hydrolase [Fibrobacter sp.]|jgi:8-oxo-dGTP pyrophosphatase MutT (NUDIX family)|nr:NUDIX hydrolase [Fibrobacter sp.]
MTPDKFDRKIRNWISDVSKAGCTVNKVETISEIRKKNGDLLFALLDIDVRSPEGVRLPNIAFIRGHACLIVTLLKNKDTGEEKYLMVRQRRIGNGQLSLEFPAGMLDEESDAGQVIIRELQEETGLEVLPNEIFPLTDKILYSSAGACDEGIYYFGCIKELDNNQFCSFRGRKGGNPEENEDITVVLMSREEAEPQCTSLQARLGFFLFEKYLIS